ncbi:MAG: NAD-dependent DNA ligase LigA [Myxococcales bacterium]|nr:NAD-dependent DNA ligase LigA [Myxococcales bacterium]
MAQLRKISATEIEAMSPEQLEGEITRHNTLYWDSQEPEISDYDYDRLIERLRAVRPDSPLLGDFGAERFGADVAHSSPMLSLDKCYDDAQLMSWASKFEGDVAVTPKMDGVACAIRYDDSGRLAIAATRGNGTVGDDITRNVATIADVPNRIEGGPLEVRGEIYMKLSVFERYKDQFANPRNLAAGAIKQKDSEKSRAYGLSFAGYDLLGSDAKTEAEKFERIIALGFPEMERLIVNKDELTGGYRHFAEKRDSLDFEIDGVVFKANELSEHERLGATGHHPRYALAYKFQGDQGTTTLDAIEWSVARSGAITPVALIAPVTLSGAEVRRASLHNWGYLQKLGMTIGAKIVVTRRGGVIPHVEFVAEPGEEKIVPPKTCPSCGSDVTQVDDFLFCSHPLKCPDVQRGTIKHFCKVVDIQGFGDKLLAEAFDKQILVSVVDIYTLSAEKLLEIERVGDKTAENLLAQVDAHREIELATFLRALGIEDLGQQVSRVIADHFETLAAVRAATREQVAALSGFGDIMANNIVSGLTAEAEIIDALLEHVTLLEGAAAAAAAAAAAGEGAAGSALRGKSFVFTGKLESFDRKTAQKLVKERGGEAPAGVTKELSYLVVGDGKEDKKSSKQKKAEKYVAEGCELKIISESEFKQMLEQDDA